MDSPTHPKPLLETDPIHRYTTAPELKGGQAVGNRFMVLGKMLDGKRVVKGGHADIYRALDFSYEEAPGPAVIKVQQNTRAENYAAQFALEVELTRAMSERTDQVPKFLGAGNDVTEKGKPFSWLATEEMEGSFDRIIYGWSVSGEKPDADKIQSILVSGLGVVAIMHDELDLAHKDVKPANIYSTRSFKGKMGDFGTAGAAKSVNVQALREYNIPLDVVTEPLTDTDLVYGTEAFMPPEALVLGNEVDPKKADVYAGGLTLHLAMTGGRKLEERKVLVNGRMRVERVVPDIDEHDNTAVPRAMAELAFHMMDHNPLNRPTMREAVDELQRI